MSSAKKTEYSRLSQDSETDKLDEVKIECNIETENEKNSALSGINIQRTKQRTSQAVDQWTQRDLNTELLTAIYECDLEQVKSCLREGASPNSTCRSYQFTAIHLAILVNNAQILLKLLQKGATPNEVDSLGLSALHYAAWFDCHCCMEILLKQVNRKLTNDFINKRSERKCRLIPENLKDSLDHTCNKIETELPQQTESGSTALHLACQKVNLKCVESLLREKVSVNVEDDRGLTPLDVIGEYMNDQQENVKENFVEIINLMIRHGAKKGLLNSHNYFTPLHAAVSLRSKTGIHLLVKTGLDPKRLNSDGETPIHLAIIKQLQVSLKALLECVQDDVSIMRNAKGFTPFQSAVERQWVQGVGLLLSANSNITEIAADGRTVLHVAAVCGNVDLLEELLQLDNVEKILNARNQAGETPIFCAITGGNYQCVNALLEKGADIRVTLYANINVLHRAAEQGDTEILSLLLTAATEQNLNLINEQDTMSFSGMSPLHMAAMNDHVECVQELLHNNCDYKLKTHRESAYKGAMAIHLAASRGNDEVVEALLKHDNELISTVDNYNRNPLHCAALQGHRKCIEVLIETGADIGVSYDGETSLDMIFRNVTRPTEFLENIFDNSVQIDDRSIPITDKHCMITIDFNVLLPKGDNYNQMCVLSNLLTSGTSLGQRKLLLHPLVESFLHLKWKKMSRIFWILLVFYALFNYFLTVFVISLFYYDDEDNPRPHVLENTVMLRFVLIIFLISVTIPEVLLALQRLKQYTMNVEKCMKWGSILLVFILVWVPPAHHQDPWLRHIASIAVLMSWIEMMFLLSKFPVWGYYVQMFFKVSSNVLKVMTVFSFLVVGFALAFMIEFHSTEEFMNPLTGFIKTIVMMTAELDYSDLFTGENIDNAHIVNLTLFVLFLLLGTIVLMNLMVGLAVSDIHDLEIMGKMDRHAQQIDFLSILESDTLARFLPHKMKMKLVKDKLVQSTLRIYPAHPKCKVMKLISPQLKNSIIDIAENNVRRDTEITLEQLSEKLNRLTNLVEVLLSTSNNNLSLKSLNK